MDRPHGLSSRPGSISCVPWPSETLTVTPRLRDCSAEAAMERQMGLNHHQHLSFSGYAIQSFGQGGRDAIGQQLGAYPMPQQQHQVNFNTAGAAPTPSRSLSSHNWRVLCPDGNVFTRSPPSIQTSAAHIPGGLGQYDRRGIAPAATAGPGPGAVNDGYAYYLNRGNGELTRLVPADMLPALNEIPPREPERRGMVVLPPLRGVPPKGMADMSQAITVKACQIHGPQHPSDLVQNQIDRIVATSPSTPKRNKVYCDMWIHEGRCAFTQTGCKFKHEMPLDEGSQKALGLFQGLPAWYKKQQEESNLWRSHENSSSETSSMDSSSHNEFAWQNSKTARVSRAVDSLTTTVLDKSKLDTCNPSQATKGRIAQFVWGPIGPPNKPASDKDLWSRGLGSSMFSDEAASTFASEGRRVR